MRGLRRQRLGRRVAGRRRSCRLPRIEPVCARLRRHAARRAARAGHPQRGRVERRGSRRRRGRGRRQHAVRPAGVAAGACRDAGRRQPRAAREARRAGRRRRCVAADRLRSVDRRHGHGDGRHERGRAAVGRADRADQRGGQCGGRCVRRLGQSGALQESRCAARHHARLERDLRGRAGLGCLHGPRQPERRAARRDPDAQAVELTAAVHVFPHGAGFLPAPFSHLQEQHDGHRFRIFRRRVSAASRRPQFAWRAADRQPGRVEPRP
ncbi:hypothetical protein BCEP4_910028 [Burkholderia cepacia]|nr:hypothetical protein BCEP4_910028 [Burkholderia cepacia]